MGKYLSREFLLCLSLAVTATVALFTMDKVGFTEWGVVTGGFLAAYITGKTVQKVKANGK